MKSILISAAITVLVVALTTIPTAVIVSKSSVSKYKEIGICTAKISIFLGAPREIADKLCTCLVEKNYRSAVDKDSLFKECAKELGLIKEPEIISKN